MPEHSPLNIAPGIDWIGALDPDLEIFDLVFATPYGSTYNSYLVRGTNHNVVLDTVKAGFEEQFFSRMENLLPPERVDTLVVHHTEPDHSGALSAFLDRNPDVTLLCSRPASKMLESLLRRRANIRVVADGEELDLGGGKVLRFLMTPFMHWPDTMMTFEVASGTLFSCDPFGAHFCDRRMWSDLVDAEKYMASLSVYYRGILHPYRSRVADGLAHLAGLDPRFICPSHGPMHRENPRQWIDLMAKWSAPPEGPGLMLVLYISAHGLTARMAQAVHEGAREVGGDRVRCLDLTTADPAELDALIEQAKVLALGFPTMVNDVPPPITLFLAHIAHLPRRKDLAAGVFGSFGWSGEAIPRVLARLGELKIEVVGTGLKTQMAPSVADLEACRSLGRELAGRLGG